jgi:hypothetical protein
MSKSFRRHKKSSRLRFKSRNGKLRSRKLRSRKLRSRKLRSRTRKLRGGNEDKIKCCICEKTVDLKDTFVPRECLMKHNKAAHRICQDCWWNKDTGFALETSSHKCPGCQKGLPLTPYKKEAPIFVDLTED